MKQDRLNVKYLETDNVYPKTEIKNTSDIYGCEVRNGLTKSIYSGGKLVNVVSDSYGFLSNENFFPVVEKKLGEGDIDYTTRSINRGDSSFAVDYILQDDRYHVNVKNGMDKIKPMLRFTNSYDGSCKTAGYFGFYREICSNGLTIAHGNIGFSIKHRGNMIAVVLPEVKAIIQKFMDNEFYSLHRKFEVLAERPLNSVKEVQEFVQYVCGKTKLFRYDKSEKNQDPSKLSQQVINTIWSEANRLETKPNLWLGYNAFNEYLHGTAKKTFSDQRNIDNKLFELVSAM